MDIPEEDTLGYLVAAHVCSKWRAIALSSPRTLSIRPRQVAHTLAVFRTMPLELFIDDRLGRVKTTCAAVRSRLEDAKDAKDRLVGVHIRAQADKWAAPRPAADSRSTRELMADLAVLGLRSIIVREPWYDSEDPNIVDVALPDVVRNSLRALELAGCTLHTGTNLGEYSLKTLALQDCTVLWTRVFAGDLARLAGLRVLVLKGRTLVAIDACEKLKLCGLQELTLEGKMDRVLVALEKVVVPPSASLRLVCDGKDVASSTLLITAVAKHFVPARAGGNYFTCATMDYQNIGCFRVFCSVPGACAKVLNAHTHI